MVEEKRKGRGFRKNGKPTPHFPTNIVIEDECGEITTDMQVCIIGIRQTFKPMMFFLFSVTLRSQNGNLSL